MHLLKAEAPKRNNVPPGSMETTLDSKTGWSGMILVRFAHGAWDGASAATAVRNARNA